MKITDVRTTTIIRRYADAPRNTHHVWSERRYVLVSIETDAGVAGLGEIYTDGHNATEVLEATVREDVAPHILGRDPREIGAITASLVGRQTLSGRAGGFGPILAGIDIALWDVLGRIAGLPLWVLLGGSANQVRTYASGGMYGPDITPESLAREMATAVASGDSGVKIKVGAARIPEDVARVAAIREAVGPDVQLMVDAMFAPSVGGALELARALAPFDLHFLEAPTHALDLRGWERIRDVTGIPLSGPELESSVDLMRDILHRDVVQFLQYDVTLAGGLSRGRDLAALARAHHRQVTLHCATSAIGLAASLHLGAAIGNCDSVEHHVLHQGLHDLLWQSGWTRTGGGIAAPDAPGLGLPFDLDDILRGEEAA